MKKIFNILIILVLMFSLTSCKNKKVEEPKVPVDDNTSPNVVITLSEYEKLKVGMTYEEVTKIGVAFGKHNIYNTSCILVTCTEFNNTKDPDDIMVFSESSKDKEKIKKMKD